jgi:SAM-dependent methyltransferase
MTTAARFRAAYAEHRASEGRGGQTEGELLALPYVRTGPLARQWAVRARSFERFVRAVVAPAQRAQHPRPLDVLDLGAGNGWLSYRLALRGCRCVALDWRRDGVDGLGAGAGYADHLPALFARVAASFDAIPVTRRFDLVVFNAALHYAESLDRTLAQAVRAVRPGGRVVILDSPFYRRPTDGERMVTEKRATARRAWGARAGDLLALPMIEYLTAERLRISSARHGLVWRRHRVRYPMWYELRPLVTRLRGGRPPSRFDVWEGTLR